MSSTPVKNDGGPAFPFAALGTGQPGVFQPITEGGMSLRDYFAAKAMQGFIASNAPVRNADAPGTVARAAYIMADAMLAAREEKP